jgi:hypothetical protein
MRSRPSWIRPRLPDQSGRRHCLQHFSNGYGRVGPGHIHFKGNAACGAPHFEKRPSLSAGFPCQCAFVCHNRACPLPSIRRSDESRWIFFPLGHDMTVSKYRMRNAAFVSLLAMLASGTAFAQQRPSAADIDAVVRSMTDMIKRGDSAIEVKIGSQNYDPATGDLSIKDIAITGPASAKTKGAIKEIIADNLSMDQGDGIAVDVLSVNGLSFEADDANAKGSFTFPNFEIRQGRMPLGGPKADANGVTDYLGWTRGFAWQSMKMAPSSGFVRGENGRLDFTFATDEQNFGTLADGVIDKASMFGVKMNGKLPDETTENASQEFTLDWGTQTMEGLNFGAYALLLTGVGEKGERPVVSMIKKTVVGPIRFKLGNKVDMTFEGAEAGEMNFKPMRVGYVTLLQQAMAMNQPGMDPMSNPENMKPLADMLEDMTDMIEMKSLVYKGLEVKISDPNPITIKVASIEAENTKTFSYGRMALKGFELNGVDPDGAPIAAKLDRFEIRDFDLSGIYKEIANMMRSRWVPNFSSIERNLPLLGKWEIEGLYLAQNEGPNPFGEISLKRANLNFGPYVGVIPGSIDFNVEELKIAGQALKEMEANEPNPAQLGYDSFNVSFGAKAIYDTAKSQIVVGPIYSSGKDMGNITFNLQIGGVKRFLLSIASVMGASMNNGATYLSSITFDGLSFDMTDMEIIRRVMDWEAKSKNKPLADIKAEQKDKISIGLESGPLPQDWVQQIKPAVDAFIDNPSSFRLVVQAKEPVTLGELVEGLENPALLQKFSVEASANSQ